MTDSGIIPVVAEATGMADGSIELGRQNALLKAGALQNAILTSANFSIIATDEKGIIQLFNVGAERMLGYTAAEVVNRISPSDIHDPQEVMARRSDGVELATTIAPGSRRSRSRLRAGSRTATTYVHLQGGRPVSRHRVDHGAARPMATSSDTC
jgi:PAS domain-containing protein